MIADLWETAQNKKNKKLGKRLWAIEFLPITYEDRIVLDVYLRKKITNTGKPLYKRYILYKEYKTWKIYVELNMNINSDDLTWASRLNFLVIISVVNEWRKIRYLIYYTNNTSPT